MAIQEDAEIKKYSERERERYREGERERDVLLNAIKLTWHVLGQNEWASRQTLWLGSAHFLCPDGTVLLGWTWVISRLANLI